MLTFILIILLTALLLFLLSALKIYHHIPARELKRQAAHGDKVAKQLYSVVSFGPSLDVLLWLKIGIVAAVLFVVLAATWPWPLALIVSMIIIWVGFAWLPTSSISKYVLKMVVFVTPAIHWGLEHTQALLKHVTAQSKHLHLMDVHTGMYTKDDILDLIEKQKVQIDSRITAQELDIVKHALVYGDKTVEDVMTPQRLIKTVSPIDMIGPVLMGELHKSGHSRFPVQDKEKGIVGTLLMRDMLKAKAGGFVKDVMRKDVFYVNEARKLSHVLDAFIKTKHHLFLVVNNFEEIVGLITIEDVIEQILGKPIMDEFDQYEDLRAVAAEHAEKDRQEHQTIDEPSDKPTAEAETEPTS